MTASIQNAIPDNIFDVIAAASPSGGGNYFDKHGKYLLGCLELKLKNGNEGLCCISEWVVLEAAPIGLTDEKGPHAVGDHRSIVWNYKKHKSAPGNTSGLALALGGFTEAEGKVLQPDGKTALSHFIKDICSEKQPLRGKAIQSETYNQKIKTGPNAGMNIMLHNWTHVPEAPAAWQARAKSWAADSSQMA